MTPDHQFRAEAAWRLLWNPTASGDTLNVPISLAGKDKLVQAIRALQSERDAMKAERNAALRECSDWARKAGEAIGRLETSEAAGIVDGWRERAELAEAERNALKARVETLEEAMRAAARKLPDRPSVREFLLRRISSAGLPEGDKKA